MGSPLGHPAHSLPGYLLHCLHLERIKQKSVLLHGYLVIKFSRKRQHLGQDTKNVTIEFC